MKVCVLALHLAKELCQADEDGDQWLQVTRKLPMLPMLFSALEVSLRVKQNLHFCEAALHLLFTLAKTHQVSFICSCPLYRYRHLYHMVSLMKFNSEQIVLFRSVT